MEAAITERAWICTRSSAYMLWLFTWGFCVTPNRKSACIYDSFVCSRELFPPRLFRVALMCRFVPSLIVSCYAMFSGYPREADFFQKGNRYFGRRGHWRKGGRENCGQEILNIKT